MVAPRRFWGKLVRPVNNERASPPAGTPMREQSEDFESIKHYAKPGDHSALPTSPLFLPHVPQVESDGAVRGNTEVPLPTWTGRTLAESLANAPTPVEPVAPNPSRASSVQPRRSEDSAGSLLVASELTSKILEIDEMLRRVLVILDKEDRAANIETRSISSTVRSQEDDDRASVASHDRDARFLRKVERLFIGRYIAAVKRKFKKKSSHGFHLFKSSHKNNSVKAACEDDSLRSPAILPICDGRCELPADSAFRDSTYHVFELDTSPRRLFELDATSRLPSSNEEPVNWGEKPARSALGISSSPPPPQARSSSPSPWATVSPWMTDLQSLLGRHLPNDLVTISVSPASLEYQPNPVIFSHLRKPLPPNASSAKAEPAAVQVDDESRTDRGGSAPDWEQIFDSLSPPTEQETALSAEEDDDSGISLAVGGETAPASITITPDSLPTFSAHESASPQASSSGRNEGSQDDDKLTCRECNISFRTVGLKRKHTHRKHVRRFRCADDSCDSSFNLKADLKRHERTVHRLAHTLQETWGCPNAHCQIPGKLFTRRDNFQRHKSKCDAEQNRHGDG